MTRRKYDAACYYAGKKIGSCTVADSEAYVILMENCGNDAARVLREYKYFSPELKNILTKVAAIQAAEQNISKPSKKRERER